jgi:hypothetical protein
MKRKLDKFERWLSNFIGTYKNFPNLGNCGHCKGSTAELALKEYRKFKSNKRRKTK